MLPCVASRYPLPIQYEWFKDDRALLVDGEHIVKDDDPTVGTITINEPTASNKGSYSYSASNSWGKALSDKSRIYYAEITAIPTAATVTVALSVGDPLKLPSRQPSKNVGLVKYSWATSYSLEDANVLSVTLDRRVNISNAGDLYFANILSGDSLSGRIYKCLVKNEVLDDLMVNGILAALKR